MPTLAVNGTELYYEDSGGAGPPLLLSHGLLWSGRVFSAQVAVLREHFRCITYDHRGQGRSADSVLQSIGMDLLAEDAVALITALGLAPCHFVGLSMGGIVGLRLALRRPELLRSLVLIATSADPEPAENMPRYRKLNLAARVLGVWSAASRVMPIMFGRTFLADPARAAERAEWRERLKSVRPSIWRAVNGVLARDGIYAELGRVRTPTLVMVGEEDVATPPERAERLEAAIPGAHLVRIARAGHTPTVENAEAVTAELLRFLAVRAQVA